MSAPFPVNQLPSNFPPNNPLPSNEKLPATSSTGHQYSWRVVLAMENNVVLTTVCVGLGVYVVLAVSMILRRWLHGKTPLYAHCRSGRTLKSTNAYIITLVTGSRPGAGTEGVVRLTLHGQSENSNDVVIDTTAFLSEIGKNVLQRGQLTALLITSHVGLGNVQFMEVELSSAAYEETWFLSYATVLDLGNKTYWHLTCHSWLTATEGKPHGMVLLSEAAGPFSLMMDNIFRGMSELHLWIAPWTSLLQATRLQCLYSITLVYCLCSCFMFTYMLVFYAPFGDAHLVPREFTSQEKAYLVASSFFITFTLTLLQLLMRMISLKTGSFLSNYTVVCVGADLEPDSDEEGGEGERERRQHPEKFGSIFERRIQEAMHDENLVLKMERSDESRNNSGGGNANRNATAVEKPSVDGLWERLWREVRCDPEEEARARRFRRPRRMSPGVEAELENWVRASVEESCATWVSSAEDDGGGGGGVKPGDQLRESVAARLRNFFDEFKTRSNSFRMVSDDADAWNHWTSSGSAISEGSAEASSETVRPTVELLSNSINVRAVNSTLRLLEVKLKVAFEQLVENRDRSLGEISSFAAGDDGGRVRQGGVDVSTRGRSHLDAKNFLWDYTDVRQFRPSDVLSAGFAVKLTKDRLDAIARRTLGDVTSLGLPDAVDRTVDSYVDADIDDVVADVARAVERAVSSETSQHETLLRYGLETDDDVREDIRRSVLPAVTKSVTATLADEIYSLEEVALDLRTVAVAAKYVNVVLNNVALVLHVRLCRMASGRSDDEAASHLFFPDVFAATETGRLVDEAATKMDGNGRGIDLETLGRIRSVFLEVELIGREDLNVGRGATTFPKSRNNSYEWNVVRRVVGNISGKVDGDVSANRVDATSTGNDDEPTLGGETSELIWSSVIGEAQATLDQNLDIVRANVQRCSVASLATLGEALYHGIAWTRHGLILESVTSEMEETIVRSAVESVSEKLRAICELPVEEEALEEVKTLLSKSYRENWNKSKNNFDGDEINETALRIVSDLRTAYKTTDRRKQETTTSNRIEDANRSTNRNSRDIISSESTNQNNARLLRRSVARHDGDFDRPSSRDQRQLSIDIDPSRRSNDNDDEKMTDVWIDRRDVSSVIVLAMSYVLFVMLVVLCVASLSGTLALGVALSYDDAMSWVNTLDVGLLVQLSVLETFKVFCVAFYFAFCQRKLIMC